MARHSAIAPRASVPGMLGVLLGGAAVLVSFVALDWYRVAGGADSVGSIDFSRLSAGADNADYSAIVPAYFDWLAWVALIAVIAVGMAANIATVATSALRIVGLLLGLVGVVATYYALDEFQSLGDQDSYALHNADLGIWFAMGGFLLAGIGAAIGPRHV